MRRIRPGQLPASAQARAVLDRFCRAARAAAPGHVGRIIVFGSMARGEGAPESDLDLLVEWTGRAAEGWRTLGDIAADLFLETGLIVSVHVVDREHGARLRAMDSAFLAEVEKEGLIVEA